MAHLENLAEKLGQTVRPIDRIMGAIESNLLAGTARWASWAISIPNVVLLSRATADLIALSGGLAVFVAIAMELASHGLVGTWQAAKEWNQTKRQSDPRANAALMLAFVVLFFSVDVITVATLAFSGWTWARPVVILAYPAITAMLVVATTERVKIYTLEQARKTERAERAETRRKRRAEKRKSQPETKRAETEILTELAAAESDTLTRARIVYDTFPGITGSELGRKLGVTERQGRNLKAEIVSGNGNGNGQH